MKGKKSNHDSFFWRRVRRYAEHQEISIKQAANHIARIDARQESRKRAQLNTAEGQAQAKAHKEQVAKASAELKKRKAAEKASKKAARKRFLEDRSKVRIISGGAPSLGKKK